MAIPTQVLTDEQIASFEHEVIAKGIKLNNWWAKQVAAALRQRETPAGKRDVVQGCLDEVRYWRASAPSARGGSPKPTTVEAWKHLVEDWQRARQDLC
jgi:hypothetical protein